MCLAPIFKKNFQNIESKKKKKKEDAWKAISNIFFFFFFNFMKCNV